MELNHEFVDCFTDFDYTSIVGNELWEAFKTSTPDHSLQYDGNTWILSNKEFVYPCYKTPLSGIPTRFRLSATEAVQMTVEDQK